MYVPRGVSGFCMGGVPPGRPRESPREVREARGGLMAAVLHFVSYMYIHMYTLLPIGSRVVFYRA